MEYLFWLTCLIRRNSFPSVSIGASTYRNRALLLMIIGANVRMRIVQCYWCGNDGDDSCFVSKVIA
ncbi:hypothetical protein CUMW_243970 [Citrus unshiu]|uniref:Uncharacterized protein n=1 Tax=Citrus unshiu TaxID=55188 RepID=A0A2H5QMG2_CITUN|nr:hypothetical protein CUMW_243970 [Citrus unshiu]